MSPLRANLLVCLAFAALAAILTYPQVLHFATSVPFHSDPYFSIWRLGWVARQIVRDPRHLFEANIFFPEHDTLAYSDAMLLPGLALAPFFWAGVNPIATYNIALLASMALSGFTAFLLARRLTDCVSAGLVAGTIYGFAPYRFTHYMHLELQIVFWIPLILLFIHKVVDAGRLRDGVLLGLLMAAQLLSSVYAALFLATYCVLFVPLLLLARGREKGWVQPTPFLLAAVVAAAVAAPYAMEYRRAERSVGSRSLEDVQRYSASLRNYFQAPQINRLYGSTAVTNLIWANEMNLFPGITALAMGTLGLLLAKQRIRLVYLGGLLLSFDLSRGVSGFLYPLLYRHVPEFRGLRSPARIDILVNVSLAMLAAYGIAWLLGRIDRPNARRIVTGAILLLLAAEYASLPEISPAPAPSRVDSWLARQPPVVIVELPLASRMTEGQSRDWLYMYEGIGHGQRMLNGYSGFAPASYYAMRDVMEDFPDDRSMAFLRDRGVDYVIVRGGMLQADQWAAMYERIRARDDLSLVMMYSPKTQAEAVYAVRK